MLQEVRIYPIPEARYCHHRSKMSCSAPKISYLFQPAIMKLLNTYKLRIYKILLETWKLLTTGPDLSFNVIVTFFFTTNVEWAKKNPKGGEGGGDKERQAMTSYECPIPKHWQRQITPKKMLKHKKGEDTRRVPSKAWVGGVITKLQSKGSVTDRIWKDIQIKLVRNPLVQPLAEL